MKSFRSQCVECQNSGNCVLRPCDKTDMSLHNGAIRRNQEYWCIKHNKPCSSQVCIQERIQTDEKEAG